MVQWIKITTGIFEDEKIRLIDAMPERDAIFVIWVRLLTLAGKVNDSGKIYLAPAVPYTDEMLATLFNRPLNVVRLGLQVLEDFKMIEILSDQSIKITNWEKHQNIDGLERIREQTRIRVARYRESKRIEAEKSNVTERYRVLQGVTGEKKEKKEVKKPPAKGPAKRHKPLPDKEIGGSSSNVTVALCNASDKNRIDKNKSTEGSGGKEVVKSESTDLFNSLKDAFVAIDPEGAKSWNWNIQGPALKKLAARFMAQENPLTAAHAILTAYYRTIRTSRDRFWRSRPFTPADLNSEAIFTQVWAMARKQSQVFKQGTEGLWEEEETPGT